jgi:hypothetical protein
MNPREFPSPSEKPKQDGEAEHDEPDDLDQKEGLARDRARLATAIADLAVPHLGHPGAGVGGVGTATPVGHAVDAADCALFGIFPGSIVNCTFLEELNTYHLYQTGKLPDFSPMKSLRILDLSYNL